MTKIGFRLQRWTARVKISRCAEEALLIYLVSGLVFLAVAITAVVVSGLWTTGTLISGFLAAVFLEFAAATFFHWRVT